MNVLLRILRAPEEVTRLSTDEWDRLIPLARRNKLLGWLDEQIQCRDLASLCPIRMLRIIKGYRAEVDAIQLQARAELRQIHKTLIDLGIPMIAIKGCAYMLANPSLARGRYASDVDLMVPASALDTVENRLLQKGWETEVTTEYDQRYYREWSHEIPPMKHPERGIELDLHHHILPPTTRLHPDVELLWQAARTIENSPFQVLAPTDMLLHSATHLFYSGDLTGGLRDLVDIHQMLATFSTEPDFWQNLLPRARQLDLSLPLYYALHLSGQLLATPIPAGIVDDINRATPNLFTASFTRLLMRRVLTPRVPITRQAAISEWLLFVRSHWIRMPPMLLVRHLVRKSLYRLKKR